MLFTDVGGLPLYRQEPFVSIPISKSFVNTLKLTNIDGS